MRLGVSGFQNIIEASLAASIDDEYAAIAAVVFDNPKTPILCQTRKAAWEIMAGTEGGAMGREGLSMARKGFMAALLGFACSMTGAAHATSSNEPSLDGSDSNAKEGDKIAELFRQEPEILFNAPYGVVEMPRTPNALRWDGDAGSIMMAFDTNEFPSAYAVGFVSSLPSTSLSLEHDSATGDTIHRNRSAP